MPGTSCYFLFSETCNLSYLSHNKHTSRANYTIQQSVVVIMKLNVNKIIKISDDLRRNVFYRNFIKNISLNWEWINRMLLCSYSYSVSVSIVLLWYAFSYDAINKNNVLLPWNTPPLSPSFYLSSSHCNHKIAKIG